MERCLSSVVPSPARVIALGRMRTSGVQSKNGNAVRYVANKLLLKYWIKALF